MRVRVRCFATLRELSAAQTDLELAATATVPGLRRLEAALAMLRNTGSPGTAVAAVLGPARRKWPRAVAHSTGPLTTALADAQRLVVVPTDPKLAKSGLDGDPLPARLLEAATRLLHLTDVVPAWKDPQS